MESMIGKRVEIETSQCQVEEGMCVYHDVDTGRMLVRMDDDVILKGWDYQACLIEEN